MGVVDDTLGTNIFGENSTDKALKEQRRAGAAAMQSQERMFNQAREDQMPWMQAGQAGLGALLGGLGLGQPQGMGSAAPDGQMSTGMTDKLRGGPAGGPEAGSLMRSFTMQDFEQDPGYQFRMQEGQKALERSAAARGGLGSGRMMKDLQRFGQDLASQEYGNAYNRFQAQQANQYNRLANLAGLGQSTSGALANQAMQQGQNMGNIQMGLGNAAASAGMAQANRLSNMIGTGIGAAAAFSDATLKTDVEPINMTDLREFKKAIKPYFFKYKDEQFGQGQWAGVMAQDIEKTKLGKTAVFEVNGVKKINFNKLMSAVLATMAEGV